MRQHSLVNVIQCLFKSCYFFVQRESFMKFILPQISMHILLCVFCVGMLSFFLSSVFRARSLERGAWSRTSRSDFERCARQSPVHDSPCARQSLCTIVPVHDSSCARQFLRTQNPRAFISIAPKKLINAHVAYFLLLL